MEIPRNAQRLRVVGFRQAAPGAAVQAEAIVFCPAFGGDRDCLTAGLRPGEGKPHLFNGVHRQSLDIQQQRIGPSQRRSRREIHRITGPALGAGPADDGVAAHDQSVAAQGTWALGGRDCPFVYAVHRQAADLAAGDKPGEILQNAQRHGGIVRRCLKDKGHAVQQQGQRRQQGEKPRIPFHLGHLNTLLNRSRLYELPSACF